MLDEGHKDKKDELVEFVEQKVSFKEEQIKGELGKRCNIELYPKYV